MNLFVSYAHENINYKGRHDSVLKAQGRNCCQHLTGRDPDAIYLPLAKDDFVVLNRESLLLQAALANYDINIC